ncbi:hypothetical protein [Microcystis phage Mae-JY35]
MTEAMNEALTQVRFRMKLTDSEQQTLNAWCLQEGCETAGEGVRHLLRAIQSRSAVWERAEELTTRVAFLMKNRDHQFELAQKNIKEVARLKAYIAKSQKEVAEIIADMRARDKTVEYRMRAEAAEALRTSQDKGEPTNG